MLFPPVVILHVLPLERFLDMRSRDAERAPAARVGESRGRLEPVQHRARVPSRVQHQERAVFDRDRPSLEGGIGCQGVIEDPVEVGFVQRAEDVEPAAREEWRDDFERRVLGGRADERDQPLFDAMQERVLLCLVEPVDFVDEEDRPASGAPRVLAGAVQDAADVLHPGSDRTELEELRLCAASDDPGQGGLAAPRRAPEKHRRNLVQRDQPLERLAFSDEVFLSDEFLERPRACALSQGRMCGGNLVVRLCVEEVHKGSGGCGTVVRAQRLRATR